jgi:diphthamide biosynthesis enzyme Dph1/Dph2-like protein
MKIIYSEVYNKVKPDKDALLELEKALPERFFLAYTIQFKKLALMLKDRFKQRVSGFSQVLGCSKIPKQKDVLLLSGGDFHATNLLKYAENIIVFDGKNLSKLGKEEKAKIEAENKAKLAGLLHSNSIGILISTKPGQYDIKQVLKLKQALLKLNKKPYVFIFDTLKPEDLENFQVNFWVNTACPGLEYDLKDVINSQTFRGLIDSFH